MLSNALSNVLCSASRRTVRFLGAVVLSAAMLPMSGPAAAQNPLITRDGRLAIGVPVKTKSMNATVAEVTRNGIVLDTEDGRQPLPMDGQTIVRVEGRGDTGFVQPGAIVVAWGTMSENMRLAEADFRVHLEPRQTVDAGRMINVFEDEPQINFYGRIVSLDPLVVQSLDTFVPSQRTPQGGVGQQATPVRDARITLDLYVKDREDVNVCFGADARMAEAGDQVRVTVREDRPQVAYAVTIAKQETATSPAKRKAEGEGAGKENAKDNSEKKSAGTKE